MKRNIVLFGAGFYGKKAYYRLNDKYKIVAFVDNSQEIKGQSINGVPVISGDMLANIDLNDTDIIITTKCYHEISMQLYKIGILDFYVMIEGFLYHTNQAETMVPVEISEHSSLKKESGEKNILFIQNEGCIRTHKIATVMKKQGYTVYLLYTIAPPIESYESFKDIYKYKYGFTSAAGMTEFINNSEIDIIHCSNEPDMLCNIVMMCRRPVVFDTHDMKSLRGNETFDDLVFEFMANMYSTANMYASTDVAEIARHKYGLRDKEIFALENTVFDQMTIEEPYEKLSKTDGEIHCVYEGGVFGTDKTSHRFFEDIWLKIAKYGIHIHYYSPSDPLYCKELERKSKYFHYEGNMTISKLLREMTKYDCGLTLFNINEKNRIYSESTTLNKIYEYINSGIPVIVNEIRKSIDFVETYNVGINLNLEGDIQEQMLRATKIQFSKNLLREKGLTMMSHGQELSEFYERVRSKYYGKHAD
jgi:hypothetical protein